MEASFQCFLPSHVSCVFLRSHALVRWFVHSLARSLVSSFVGSFVGSFVHWFVRSFVGSFENFIRLLVLSIVRSFVRSFLVRSLFPWLLDSFGGSTLLEGHPAPDHLPGVRSSLARIGVQGFVAVTIGPESQFESLLRALPTHDHKI